VKPVNDGLLMSNPIIVWTLATQRFSPWMTTTTRPWWAAGTGFEWDFGWMAGIQAFFGLLFLILAVAGLRPLRGTSWPGGKPQSGWWSRLSRRWRRFVDSHAAAALTRNEILATRSQRPPCGEDPMLWKERFTRMGGGLRWLGSRPVALFFIVLLGCFLLDVSVPVLGDVVRGSWRGRNWTQMNEALRASSVALAVLAMLPVSAASASSLTSEREQDTWTSLATTLLTPIEIVRGKQVGAIWSARWLGIALVVLLGAGLFLGAFHPIGLLTGVGVLVSSAWLVSAIGVLASTLASNSTRALFFTFVAMFVFMFWSRWPELLWSSLASYHEMTFLWTGRIPNGYPASTNSPRIIGALVTTAVHATIACLLTIWSVKRLRSTWGRS
jgi:hypothetical protein